MFTISMSRFSRLSTADNTMSASVDAVGKIAPFVSILTCFIHLPTHPKSLMDMSWFSFNNISVSRDSNLYYLVSSSIRIGMIFFWLCNCSSYLVTALAPSCQCSFSTHFSEFFVSMSCIVVAWNLYFYLNYWNFLPPQSPCTTLGVGLIFSRLWNFSSAICLFPESSLSLTSYNVLSYLFMSLTTISFISLLLLLMTGSTLTHIFLGIFWVCMILLQLYCW